MPTLFASESESPGLIDVHAHFLHDRCGRSDWRELNAARLASGERIGISWHIASILGSWGFTSPTYMPSPIDVEYGNRFMYEVARANPARVRAYVMVNPNDQEHALSQIEQGAGAGAIGLKLAASRKADDPLLDPLIRAAAARGFPVLHHVWQHRRREWGGQDVSDALDLCRLASRHPDVNFILAHIGGGGDYAHTFAAVREQRNVFLDLSGSGVDTGMLDGAIDAAGAGRLLWGTDITMETGAAKLRALATTGLSEHDLSLIRWRNAERIFPPGSFVEGGRSGNRSVAGTL